MIKSIDKNEQMLKSSYDFNERNSKPSSQPTAKSNTTFSLKSLSIKNNKNAHAFINSPLLHKDMILSEDSRYHRSSSSITLRPESKREEINRVSLNTKINISQVKSLLTLYEQQEIQMWKDTYFVGSNTVEKIGSYRRRTGADLHELFNLNGTTCDDDGVIHNSGYDDGKGDLYLTKHDHIAYRYEILSLLGSGSFGQVVKCFDHKEKTHVALKIIRNKKRFEKQGLVEVNVLTKLTAADFSGQYNLVHVKDHFYFRGHLCFAFELLGTNLYEWIKAGSFKGVHLALISCFAAQILKCLQLLADLKIIHCDLKPENILLKDPRVNRPRNSDSNPAYIPENFNPMLSHYQIKVIDFGSSCYESERLYTYVQSRFYRSPEVILGLPYTSAIDMWSFGCVLIELYTGYPLFPGENEADQLACIMEVKGLPPKEILAAGSRTRTFFDSGGNPRNITNSKGKKRRPASKSLAYITKCSNSTFLDFIHRCLDWDPAKRLKPSKALEHPFIAELFKNASISDLEKDYESYTLSSNTEDKPSSSFEQKTKSIIRKFPSTTSFLRLNASNQTSSKESKSKLPTVASLDKWKSSIMASKGRKIPSYEQAYFSKSSQSLYTGKTSLPPISVNGGDRAILKPKIENEKFVKLNNNNNNIINEDEEFEKEMALLNKEIAKELVVPTPPIQSYYDPEGLISLNENENSIEYDEKTADEFNAELRIQEEEKQKAKGLSRISKIKEKREKIVQLTMKIVQKKIKQPKKQRVVKPFESDEDSN